MGSTQNLPSSVTWSSSEPSVATIGPLGAAQTVSPSTSTITAKYGSLQGSATLNVTGAALASIVVSPVSKSVVLEATPQFTATGRYTDGTSANLTNSVTWSSSDPAVASITVGGLAATPATGVTTIAAALGAVTGSATLTVTGPTPLSIAVLPAHPSVAAGTSRQFTATGRYSNGTRQDLTSAVAWASSDPAAATIDPMAGLAVGRGAGTTTVAAVVGTVTDSTTLTGTVVTLVFINVVPTPGR